MRLAIAGSLPFGGDDVAEMWEEIFKIHHDCKPYGIVYVCIVCVCAREREREYVCEYAYVYVHVSMCMYIIPIHTCMHTHKYTIFIRVCMPVYVHACVCGGYVSTL